MLGVAYVELTRDVLTGGREQNGMQADDKLTTALKVLENSHYKRPTFANCIDHSAFYNSLYSTSARR